MTAKYLLRINFEAIPDDLGDDLCLVKGYLLMVQDPNNEGAYGYHIKCQGGGSVGEYHVVAKWYDEDGYWDFAYGDFLEPFDSDLLSTASELEGFNAKGALNVLEEAAKLRLAVMRRSNQVGDIPPSYEGMYFVYKSRLDNTKVNFESNSFWYSSDECLVEDNIGALDVESLSEMIPGNMMFSQ